MPPNFIACDREQEFLLPPSLRDWLPEGHLAWFVIDAVAALDLSGFYADYRDDGWGRPAHDPAMVVALLLYAYAVGERSARAIERRCEEDVAFRVIGANRVPDHATIARFRARHERSLAEIFTEVLGLCARAGLVRAGVVVLDSTKLEANASGHANASYGRIVEEILAEAAAVDAAEDERFGERRGDELPDELRDARTRREWLERATHELRDRQAERPPAGRARGPRLREAKRRLEEQHALEGHAVAAYEAGRRRREAELAAVGRRMPGRRRTKPLIVPAAPTGQINVTDPDSRPVRTARGFIQGYNAQAVAVAGQIIVAADVVVGSPDQGRLDRMAAQAQAELAAAGGELPRALLADGGYWNHEQITALRDRGLDVLIPPDGQDGPARNQQPLAAALRARLATDEGAALYRQRQRIIEPIFGQTKHNRRLDRFLRRGRAACRSEWRLIAATHNLRG